MNFDDILDQLRRTPRFRNGLAHTAVIPAQPPRFAPVPDTLDPRLTQALARRGIQELYSHQTASVAASLAGKDVVVVTPTASGKTLCYNLPVLHRVLQAPESRALYLFPTKALSQDQLAELHELTANVPGEIKTFTYDGDTPADVRRTVRLAAHIVVTNPDMLHAGILPHHTKWVKLFENLAYVVVDEIHHYRGVFGSHLANVLRRLDRICQFYGSRPQFVTCSATIGNPGELASGITGRELLEITESGAPRGERHLWLYNPPVVNQELGVRRSSVKEAAALAVELIRHGVQTICFARSRTHVEVLLTYIRDGLTRIKKDPDSIQGYRGGYLPNERRAIERGLRDRTFMGVVSTNALELGVDIGGMDACIISGFPGSISSMLQQFGRAGRRQGPSLAVLVGSSNPLDQFLMEHPEYLTGAAPESGIIHPDNLVIRVNQIKCAAFELPFESQERFGGESEEKLGEVLSFLEENRVLKRSGPRYHWMSDVYPAQEVSLRTASTENFVIFDTGNKNKALGEVDHPSAPFMIHEQAIYLHQGRPYIIEKLDWENRQAFAKPVSVDYYTDAEGKSEVKVLDCFKTRAVPGGARSVGEVAVTTLPVLFKKIRFMTHENLGWGRITLPELELQTMAYWLSLDHTPRSASRREAMAGVPLVPPPVATAALVQGSWEPGTLELDEEDEARVSAARAPREPVGQDVVSGGLKGLANVLGRVVPLFVLCDPGDVRVVTQVNSPFTQRPTIFIYDVYPGGVGLAERIFENHDRILEATAEVIRRCACGSGCPSCVGPALAVGENGKDTARDLAETLL